MGVTHSGVVHKSSKPKKSVFSSISRDNLVDDIRSDFYKHAKDYNGKKGLDKESFVQLALKHKLASDEELLSGLFEICDQDHNRVIELDEYEDRLIPVFSMESSIPKLEAQFQLWDTDKDGVLTSQDVAEILNAGEIHRKLKKGISTVYNNPSRHLSMKDFVLLLQDEKFQFPLTVRSNITSKMNLLDKFATEVITGQIGQVRDEVRKMMRSSGTRDTLFSLSDKSGKSLLHLAVEWKSEAMIDLLLSSKTPMDVNIKDINNRTALACAARNGDEHLFLKLQQYGALTDQLCFEYACREFCSSNTKRIIENMLKEGHINVNGVPNSREYPIHYAVVNPRENRIEGIYAAPLLTQLLLEYGADPNVVTEQGNTPLHYAVYKNTARSALLLLNHGAKLDILGSEGLSVVDLAIKSNVSFAPLLTLWNDYYHLFQSIDFSANEPDYYVIDKLVTNNISIPKFLEVTRESLINMGIKNNENIDSLLAVQMNEHDKPIDTHVFSPKLLFDTDQIEALDHLIPIDEFYEIMPSYNKRSTAPINAEAESRLRYWVKAYKLKRRNVKNDGNCLFVAISKQIFSKTTSKYRAQEIRQDAVTWLKRHPMFTLNEYKAFKERGIGESTALSNSGQMVLQKTQRIITRSDGMEQYIEEMSNEYTYGDFWMLVAIAEIYCAKIFIITSIPGSRYVGCIVPRQKHNARTIVLASHTHTLYFDALTDRSQDNGSTDWMLDDKLIEYPISRQQLGAGAQGYVEIAKYRGEQVAVKHITLGGNDTKRSNLTRYEHELDAVRNLRNRHIVLFLGASLSPQEILIVSEYMEKGSLRKFLSNEHKSSRKLRSHGGKLRYKIAKQVAQAMKSIHCAGYIHCDLTSHNILLGEGYIAKVADFGLARLTDVSQYDQRGHGCWAAPEVLRSHRDVKAFNKYIDVYSYGIILWELFTQEEPDAEWGYSTYVEKVKNHGYRPPIPKEVSSSWTNLIESCWNENPTSRPSFESIVDILKDEKQKFHDVKVHSTKLDTSVDIDRVEMKEENIISKDTKLNQNAYESEEYMQEIAEKY